LPSADVPEPRGQSCAGDGYSDLRAGHRWNRRRHHNALLATGGWIDGLSVITLDQTGLAQKGGAVISRHHPEPIVRLKPRLRSAMEMPI